MSLPTSDLNARYKALQLKAVKITSAYNTHVSSINNIQAQYKELKEKYTKGTETAVIQDASINVVKELIDKLSGEHIKEITDLVTYALQTIFWDKDYSLEIALSDKRNSKTAEMFLLEKRDNEVIRSSVTDSVGGGVQVVIGFVLQVFYLKYYKLSPIMFLDESFSQLSDIYIPYLKAFINELASNFGFIFVLVTHDSRLISGCVTAYQVSDGEVTKITETTAKKVVGAESA